MNHSTPWKTPTATGPERFTVECRATPVHGDPAMLHLSFIPPLPARPGLHSVIMTSCPVGQMFTTFSELGRRHGVTIKHTSYQMPKVLHPRDNGSFHAMQFGGMLTARMVPVQTQQTAVAL